jgi:hypothetical protein
MKRRWIGLVVAGLVVRLGVAWLPITTLIPRTLPDDAFIYFVIARNIASGLGATFDGLRPTNGFHPLWALAIAPIFRFLPNGDLPVHVALTFSAVCDVAAAALAASVAARNAAEGIRANASAMTLALYLFNPRAVQESVNGLETGLAILMLAACVAAWVWLSASPESPIRTAAFGVLAGLAVLARSDLAIIVALLGLRLVLKSQWRNLIYAGSAALLLVAPWVVWSQIVVGTVIQSSGVAIPSLAAQRIQMSTDSVELWNTLLFPIINYSLRYSIIYPGVATLAAIVGVLLARWPTQRPQRVALQQRPPLYLWLPVLGALAIVFVHTFVRWYPRGWYFAPLAWGWAVAAGPMFAAGLSAPMGKRFGVWLVVVFGLIVFGQSLKMVGEPEFASQRDMRAGAEWLRHNVRETETVGAFNAGIYSYYSGRRVLSLDGLVDWGAIEARREKRLLDYFAERGGTLIIDHEAYVASFRSFFGARALEPIVELPVIDETYGPVVVYQLR